MPIPNIYDNILSSYNEILTVENHRYKSWEYCFSYFNDLLDNHGDEDTASLQLAFYLASWGMYRGSSRLHQKDYKVHLPVIRELVKKENRCLRDINIGVFDSGSSEMATLLNLVGSLRKTYHDQGISSTDTLITKVIMGTYACLPAYDSLFQKGIGYWNSRIKSKKDQMIIKRFGKNSILSLVQFYWSNLAEFKKNHRVYFCARHALSSNEIGGYVFLESWFSIHFKTVGCVSNAPKLTGASSPFPKNGRGLG